MTVTPLSKDCRKPLTMHIFEKSYNTTPPMDCQRQSCYAPRVNMHIWVSLEAGKRWCSTEQKRLIVLWQLGTQKQG